MHKALRGGMKKYSLRGGMKKYSLSGDKCKWPFNYVLLIIITMNLLSCFFMILNKKAL
jgi:hypothetical protein